MIKLSNKQKWSIKRSTARINIWHGSVRASKTFATLIKFIQLAPIADPRGKIFLIGKTLDTLKRNIILPLMDLIGPDLNHFPGKRECRLWGRTIHTVGANDDRSEGKIRGDTIALAYGDEITLWPESFFKMLTTRLSLSTSIFIGSTNPDNPKHYLKRDYIDRAGDLDLKDFHFILDDNKFLDPKSPEGNQKIIDELKRSFVGLWYKRFILGQWCVAEGAIYDFFDEDEHTLIRAPKADYYDVGIDYGTGNPTVFLLMGNNLKPQRPYIWCENEYFYDSREKQRQKTDDEYSKDLILFLSSVTSSVDPIIEKRFGVNRMFEAKAHRIKDIPLHDIFIDPSAASLKLQLQRDGFTRIKDADNSVIDGIRIVSTMLKNGSYAICKKCKNNIDEKYAYVWDQKRQDQGEDKPMKTNDHCCDAERYVICTKFNKNMIDYQRFNR